MYLVCLAHHVFLEDLNFQLVLVDPKRKENLYLDIV
jgi:hypothetical protein